MLEAKAFHFGFEPDVVLIRGEFLLDKLRESMEEQECTFATADAIFTEPERGASVIKPGTSAWPKDA